MATTLKLKNSVTTTAAPSTLSQGEAAVNITDKKVWVGDATSTPVQILGAGAPVSGTTGTFTGNTTVAGTFAANGGATLGDASGDALTINSSAVSIPNGLNFDSNTLVIDATNNYVGIGVATPSAPLSFGVSTGQKIRFYNSVSGYGIGVESSEFRFVTDSSAVFTWGTGSYASPTERMRIDSSGNVGIGTSSPSTFGNLAVVGTSYFVGGASSTTQARFGYTDGTSYWALGRDNVTTGDFLFKNGSTEYMRLTASGNLGLGVTPSAWSGVKAMQVGVGTVLYNNTNANGTFLGSNFYYNGTNNIYIATSTATAYAQDSGAHKWYYAASGTAGTTATFTQAMTLDASGNLGIGTSSPTAKFHVSQTGTGTTGRFQSSASGSYINFVNASNSGVYIGSEGSAAYFETNGAERMRIDSSGKLLLGTTAYNYGYSGYNMIIGAAAPLLKFQSTVGAWDIYNSGSGNEKFYFAYNSADRATINQSTGAYTAISDRNKKKDFEDSSIGLDAVMQLKPTLFRMLEDAEDAPKQLGFIAQDVENVIPQAYVEEEGGMGGTFIGLQDRPFIAVLTKAIQEQQAIINDLKARIETLESK